jgi:hypothetical protein
VPSFSSIRNMNDRSSVAQGAATFASAPLTSLEFLGGGSGPCLVADMAPRSGASEHAISGHNGRG